jgi:hypothetical protein
LLGGQGFKPILSKDQLISSYDVAESNKF